MKIAKFQFTALILSLVLLLSCSKDDGSSSTGTNVINATIGKEKVKMNITTSLKLADGDKLSVFIEGQNSDSTKKISIIFYKKTGLTNSEYECDYSSDDAVMVHYSDNSKGIDTYKDELLNEGTVTISKLTDEAIKCTFKVLYKNPDDKSDTFTISGSLNSTLTEGSVVFELPLQQGKMTAIIDGVNKVFTASAMKQSGNSGGTNYQLIAIAGTSATPSQTSNFETMVFELIGSTITARKYNVRAIQDDYLNGFAIAMYFPNSSDSQNYYYTNGNNSGSVTIDIITDTYVKGSYDLTLEKVNDLSLTKSIKGKFNVKLMSVPNN
jgi:hypothetical protein